MTDPPIKVRLKHALAVIFALWLYISVATLGMLVGFTAAMLLQALGLLSHRLAERHWAVALLNFAGALTAFGLYCFLLWRWRRAIVFIAKMCWYGPKAILLWLGGAVAVWEAALGIVIGAALATAGIVFYPRHAWPEPWWAHLLALLGVGGMGLGAANVGALISKGTMKAVGFKDCQASVARSLAKIDMLAPPAPAPSPTGGDSDPLSPPGRGPG